MKDSANRSDKKDRRKIEEDLSLAELLVGGPEGASRNAPRRAADGRADEPSSGVVRLSAMIAQASAEQARVPSVVPPPVAAPAPEPVPAPRPAPVFSPPPAADQSVAIPTRRSRGGGLFAVIALCVLGAGGYYAYTQMMAPSTPSTNVEELERQIAELKAARARSVESSAAAEVIKSRPDKPESPQAQRPEPSAKVNDDKAAAVEPDKEEKAGHAVKKGKKGRATNRAARGQRNRKNAAGQDDEDEEGDDEPSAKPEPRTAPTSSAEAAELDSLLGKAKEEPKAKPKKDTAASSGMPNKPDRAAVQQAMSAVASRAQTCSKYSTGTIQIKLTVGSDGKVRSSEALGTFAGTTAGKCVEMLARAAKFPPFSDPTFTVTYPIVLR